MGNICSQSAFDAPQKFVCDLQDGMKDPLYSRIDKHTLEVNEPMTTKEFFDRLIPIVKHACKARGGDASRLEPQNIRPHIRPRDRTTLWQISTRTPYDERWFVPIKCEFKISDDDPYYSNPGKAVVKMLYVWRGAHMQKQTHDISMEDTAFRSTVSGRNNLSGKSSRRNSVSKSRGNSGRQPRYNISSSPMDDTAYSRHPAVSASKSRLSRSRSVMSGSRSVSAAKSSPVSAASSRSVSAAKSSPVSAAKTQNFRSKLKVWLANNPLPPFPRPEHRKKYVA